MKNAQLLQKLKADNIIICGSAPSINKFSLDMLRNIKNSKCIALNNAFLYENVKFDAMISVDYSAIAKNKDFINNLSILKLFGNISGPRDCKIPESLINGNTVVSFDVLDAVDNDKVFQEKDFCQNIMDEPLRFSKSVAITAIQIALWLKPKRIYLVGMDFSDEGHFNDDKNDIDYNQKHYSYVLNHWTRGGVRNLFSELKKFAYEYYPETQIISVNPITLKGVFDDVYMDCRIPRVTGYIGVKEHSTRLPGKNILPFGKSNLLINKIDQMKRSLNIEKIIVSTDSEKMLQMAQNEGIEGIRRPKELADESRPYQEFVKYLTNVLPGEHIMRCPVTAPLCDSDILNDSIEKYFKCLESGYDSLTSVLKFQHHMLDENGPINYTMDINHKGSQNLPVWYEIANCMDIVPMSVMKECLFQFGPKFYKYEVDKISATDIDDKTDYEIACAIYYYEKRIGEMKENN